MIELLKLYLRKNKSVICYRNSGLGDNLLQAIYCWNYALKTNRDLAVVWSNSLYLEDKRRNAFYDFFQVPDSISKVKLIKFDRTSWFFIYYLKMGGNPLLGICHFFSSVFDKYIRGSNKESHAFVRFFQLKMKEYVDHRNKAKQEVIYNNVKKRSKVIFFQGIIEKKLDNAEEFLNMIRPQIRLAKTIDDFVEKNFANRKVIGVHVRYYSPRNIVYSNHTRFWLKQASAFAAISDLINQAIERVKPHKYVIFLATDSKIVYDFVDRIFPHLVIFPKVFDHHEDKEFHLEKGVQSMEASIADMFLLAQSDILVRYPPDSWFSYYASVYANEIVTSDPRFTRHQR